MAHINLNSLSELPFHDLNLDQWIPEGNRHVGLFILCLKIFFKMPAAGIHTTQDMNLSKTSASHVLEHGQTNLFVSANRSLEQNSSSRERSHYIFLFQRNKTFFAVRTIIESNLNRNFIINYKLILLLALSSSGSLFYWNKLKTVLGVNTETSRFL